MNSDRLYDLLPSVYRRRDEENAGQLKALLAVITEQADLIGADLDAQYRDWFIETCQDWVAPYIGDLVGYRLLPGADEALATGSPEARRLLSVLAPRRDVAHTVGNRRRKGTLALLEDLAADVADWPARAVEFRQLLAVSQAIRLHGRDRRADRRRLTRGRSVDLHGVDALDRLDGPFDELAHSIDVRRITSSRGTGRYGIPEIGLYGWRLKPYSITHAPAYCEDRARTHYTFSILGNDTPLMVRPVREPSPNHIADETNVPAFIRRQALFERPAVYYGPGKSLCVYLADGKPVPLADIVPADLSGWRYRPTRGKVAIDPVLGRIAFPARHAPESGVWVTYHYGFSADIGAGEYPRRAVSGKVYRVGPGFHGSVMDAIEEWRRDKAADPTAREATIEFTDSGVYQEQIELPVDRGDRLTLRAASGARPVLRLLDWHSNRPDSLRINGTGQGSAEDPLPRVVFDGLLISGRSVQVSGAVGEVVLRQSTLVPGWSLGEHCRPEEASLELVDTEACLEVERSILGTILVTADEVHREPNQIRLSDSILDAGGDGLAALCAPDDGCAHAVLTARRCTVFGSVFTHGVGLVENSIVDSPMRIVRRQRGCVRFTWLPEESRTPPRFHCEPEHSGDPLRVVPRFTSVRYGTPGYAQLDRHCPGEISRGAEDGSEMGAFHDLFHPQREDSLRLRLAEYTPAGTDAGILFAT
ncbi:hypothetical protein [Amycolatopsis jejuensis]|uniref:hypothetical protein n=1 Tax=Amycolatopsis jejuensis TaxID=330084 RepID=UPI0005247F4A|nr:hypothetical protein [Amycolatopsis jejuensis]